MNEHDDLASIFGVPMGTQRSSSRCAPPRAIFVSPPPVKRLMAARHVATAAGSVLFFNA